MHHFICPNCGHDGPYYIDKITEDYVVLICPVCDFDRAITVGMDGE